MSHLGKEGLVALRSRLKSKEQTLIRAVQRERKVWEQAALVLYKQRAHTAGVLVKKTTHTFNVTENTNL